MVEQGWNTDEWMDVRLVTDPEPRIGYRTALAAYEEALIKGRFVGCGWNAAGYLNAWKDSPFDPNAHPTPQAFWLEIDGQLLASHWEWAGFDQKGEDKGLHAIVTLRHGVRPVTVSVHMLLDGTPVMTRWLEITNTGTQPAALGAAFPWSGILQTLKRWQAHLPDRHAPLFSVGYMADDHWGDEGNFQWQPLPNGIFRIDGRYRRDRHRHPMFVLHSHATGEYFIGQLAWSGGYAFEFDLDADLWSWSDDAGACLFLRAGPEAPAPQRVIAPGETVRTPEVHLGLTMGDLDGAIQAMHDHLRRSVFMPQPRGRGGWVECGIGPEVEITVPWVLQQLETAAALGAEVFFIDASWYSPPHSDWWSTVGDWQVDRQRFPEGLKPIRDRARAKGMLFGLWMDAERVGPGSRVAKEHPEWLAMGYDGERQLEGMLDLTQPVVAQWMEEQIARVIQEHELDFFRLDYNVHGRGPRAHTVRDGFVENGYWRYYEALYAIFERLRARFPHVILEACAGGGGRTDLGLVRRFSHTWVTDWPIAPRSFTITNGMTMALPPEYVDRLIAGQNGHLTGDIDFQARLLLFARPSLGCFSPLGFPLNPVQIARVRHMVDLYKGFVRPFMSTGRIYHHTPTVEGPEPQGWGVLELASRDRRKAIAGVFQLSAPREPEYVLRLRGLDVGLRYRVTWDNTGQTCEVDGFVLMKQGIVVRLEGALTSELLLFEAV
ncbi:MAG: alpha-galactosidase [Anaerolineae bacterium]|nr:alpha-galactosidase [Anaerolineae bacterium]